jgi:hypothetical protein
MGLQPGFYAFDWSKFLTALQGGVLDIFRPPFVHKMPSILISEEGFIALA